MHCFKYPDTLYSFEFNVSSISIETHKGKKQQIQDGPKRKPLLNNQLNCTKARFLSQI